jgi:hypothetical protein
LGLLPGKLIPQDGQERQVLMVGPHGPEDGGSLHETVQAREKAVQVKGPCLLGPQGRDGASRLALAQGRDAVPLPDVLAGCAAHARVVPARPDVSAEFFLLSAASASTSPLRSRLASPTNFVNSSHRVMRKSQCSGL